ncbi:hypothetical protein BDW69DRAFT_175733, partial [Aspergillus filifer]
MPSVSLFRNLAQFLQNPNNHPGAAMKLIFELLFVFGISVLSATASAATAPDLTAQQCRTLIGNMDPEGVDLAIVRQCIEYL